MWQCQLAQRECGDGRAKEAPEQDEDTAAQSKRKHCGCPRCISLAQTCYQISFPLAIDRFYLCILCASCKQTLNVFCGTENGFCLRGPATCLSTSISAVLHVSVCRFGHAPAQLCQFQSSNLTTPHPLSRCSGSPRQLNKLRSLLAVLSRLATSRLRTPSMRSAI